MEVMNIEPFVLNKDSILNQLINKKNKEKYNQVKKGKFDICVVQFGWEKIICNYFGM